MEEERNWAYNQFDSAVAWARWQEQQRCPRTSPHHARVVADLVAERQARLAERIEAGELARQTLEKAEEIHRLWIAPSLGAVKLMEWSRQHRSRSVLARASKKVGAERRVSIGSELRALVTLGHKLRWLPADCDPMEDVAYARTAKVPQRTLRTPLRLAE